MLTNIQEPMTRPVGAAPLFRQMADDIHLVPLINQMVRWDDRQTRLSPGERILVLVLDVLSGKTPLYRVWERFATTDLEILPIAVGGLSHGGRRSATGLRPLERPPARSEADSDDPLR